MKSKAKLYLVDDHVELLEVFSDILGEDFDVRVFADPEKIISELATQEMPRVIVSDIKMPGMTGLELAKKVNKIDPTIKVILLSGALDIETTVQACNLGIFAILEKPVTSLHLVETVQRAVAAHEMNEKHEAFRHKAADFVQNAADLVKIYKNRAADAETMLRGLGLLPQNPEDINKRMLEASELQQHFQNLRQELNKLEDFHKKEPPHETLRKISNTRAATPTIPEASDEVTSTGRQQIAS